jgi:hypothetical protein
MDVSLIDNHLSFQSAAEVIRSREIAAATMTPADRAHAELAKARKLIKVRQPKVGDVLQVAKTWGATKEGARRSVLRAAGLDAARWNCPIHSFSESERIAIKAAAAEAQRVFRQVFDAI